MAITETKELYEILFRFGGGQLKGAHVTYAAVIKFDDDRDPIVTPGVAEPIAIADQIGQDISGIMADATIQAAKRADEAEAEKKVLIAQVETLKAQVGVLQGKIDDTLIHLAN